MTSVTPTRAQYSSPDFTHLDQRIGLAPGGLRQLGLDGEGPGRNDLVAERIRRGTASDSTTVRPQAYGLPILSSVRLLDELEDVADLAEEHLADLTGTGEKNSLRWFARLRARSAK